MVVVLRDIFQAEVGLLTIGCKDNMFSIKVTLTGNDLQPAMTCSHSVKNIGHPPRPKVKTSDKNIKLLFMIMWSLIKVKSHGQKHWTAPRKKPQTSIYNVVTHYSAVT